MELLLSPSSPELASLASPMDHMVNSWARRAGVRNADRIEDDVYDPSVPDFPDDLIFFSGHESFTSAPETVKDRLRTAAWLLFNANTIDIERAVVVPATLALFDALTPFPALRAIVSQTMTDESYHIHITDYASQFTRTRRRLTALSLQQCEVVTMMESCMRQYAQSWKRNLVLIATAISTEVFVCSYLRRLGSAQDIQPLNTLTTRIHLKDELAHSGIFKMLAKHLCAHLDPSDKQFLLDHIAKAARWYTQSTESDQWRSILKQLEINGREQMVLDSTPSAADTQSALSLLQNFLLELGARSDQLCN